MSAEREQMRVKLANLNHQKRALEDKILTLCMYVRANLNCTMIKPKDLNVAAAASQMDDLVMVYGELQTTLFEIARLEKELE